jgi:predicted ester cyclase
MSKQKDVLLELAREISAGRTVDVEDYFTANFVLHDPNVGARLTGYEGARTMMKGVMAFAPDLKMEIVDMMEESDRVCVRWSVSGTKDGKPAAAALIAIYRFEGGRIAEDWGTGVRAAWP